MTSPRLTCEICLTYVFYSLPHLIIDIQIFSYSEYDDCQLVKALSCGHYFHTHCLDAWFRKVNTCPCCREIYVPVSASTSTSTSTSHPASSLIPTSSSSSSSLVMIPSEGIDMPFTEPFHQEDFDRHRHHHQYEEIHGRLYGMNEDMTYSSTPRDVTPVVEIRNPFSMFTMDPSIEVPIRNPFTIDASIDVHIPSEMYIDAGMYIYIKIIPQSEYQTYHPSNMYIYREVISHWFILLIANTSI